MINKVYWVNIIIDLGYKLKVQITVKGRAEPLITLQQFPFQAVPAGQVIHFPSTKGQNPGRQTQEYPLKKEYGSVQPPPVPTTQFKPSKNVPYGHNLQAPLI